MSLNVQFRRRYGLGWRVMGTMSDDEPKATRRPQDNVADAPSGDKPAAAKKRWRPSLRLATLATVVAIATGMFELRNDVFPKDSGVAQASVTDYETSIGGICNALNQAESARVTKVEDLRSRLHDAKSVEDQRNAVLDSWTQVSDTSQHELVNFEGLDVPGSLATVERTTAAAWDRVAQRLRGFVGRLEGVSDDASLLAAVKTLPATDEALAADEDQRNTGLKKLGGGQCTLSDPVPTRVVTLPGTGQSVIAPSGSGAHGRFVSVPRPSPAKKPQKLTPPVRPPRGHGLVVRINRPKPKPQEITPPVTPPTSRVVPVVPTPRPEPVPAAPAVTPPVQPPAYVGPPGHPPDRRPIR